MLPLIATVTFEISGGIQAIADFNNKYLFKVDQCFTTGQSIHSGNRLMEEQRNSYCRCNCHRGSTP
jgi:hypothetical protein